jgi:hypothetical protein
MLRALLCVSLFSLSLALSPPHSLSSLHAHSPSVHKPWQSLLVEFRGLLPHFRLYELQDALTFFYQRLDCLPLFQSQIDDICTTYSPVIPDTISNVPICAYITLPDEEILKHALRYCGLVKRVLHVWADGETIDQAAQMAEENFDSMIAPVFADTKSPDENSWRVDFCRSVDHNMTTSMD